MQADTLRSVPFLHFKATHKRSETHIYAPSRFTLYGTSETVSIFDEMHLHQRIRPFQGNSDILRCLFDASLLQAIDGVMSLSLCPQAVSQAPQHFRASKGPAICSARFVRQSTCSGTDLKRSASIIPVATVR